MVFLEFRERLDVTNSVNETLFGIQIYMKNNGTVPDKTEYILDASDIRLVGNAVFMDKRNGQSEPYENFAKQIVSQETGSYKFVAQAENVWGIRKSLQQSGGADYAIEGDKVTVTYLIETGKTDGQGNILSDKNEYDVYGTLQFEAYSVVDEIPDFVPEGNTELSAVHPLGVSAAWADGTPLPDGAAVYDAAAQKLTITACS